MPIESYWEYQEREQFDIAKAARRGLVPDPVQGVSATDVVVGGDQATHDPNGGDM